MLGLLSLTYHCVCMCCRECYTLLPLQRQLGTVHKLRCLRPPARPGDGARIRDHRRAAHHNLLHWLCGEPGLADAGADCLRILQVSTKAAPRPPAVAALLIYLSPSLSLPPRELRCLRNTIHANLFFTYIMSALFWILLLSVQVRRARYPVATSVPYPIPSPSPSLSHLDLCAQRAEQLHWTGHALPLLHADQFLLDAGRGIISLYAGREDLLGR